MQYFRAFWVAIFLCMLGSPAGAVGSGANFQLYTEQSFVESDQHALSILSAKDRKLYHRIFLLQGKADWQTAKKLIAKIEDKVLMGHVTFQRLMHPTGYRSKFYELADWLDSYADHSGAERVYRLARKRRPSGNGRKLRKPILPEKITSTLSALNSANTTKKSQKPKTSKAARAILWRVKENISEGWVSATWKKLRDPAWRNKLTDTEYVQALGDIAKGYVIHDVDEKAIKVADEALQVAANYPSQAYWWAGLAAWRQDDLPTAAEFFTFLGNHPDAQPEIASAASFWAWRAELRLGNITAAHQALIHAARDSNGFYGLLAREALSMPDSFDWQLKAENAHARELIGRYGQLKRILALAEVGQYAFAQTEVSRLRYENKPEYISTLMYIADRAGMANFTLKLGRKQRKLVGGQHDISRYPLPRWPFIEGLQIDRALLYAVILKESQFTAKIASHAGAKGLMQLMPGTARLMQKRLDMPIGEYQDPAVNITLGQEYFKYLLTLPEVDFNLVYALAGYNAGPGRLKDWRQNIGAQDDPLLFIETIPVRETRRYVEFVLRNLWVYRKRLRQDTPSLTMLLEGNWPLYQRLDGVRISAETIEELLADAH